LWTRAAGTTFIGATKQLGAMHFMSVSGRSMERPLQLHSDCIHFKHKLAAFERVSMQLNVFNRKSQIRCYV